MAWGQVQTIQHTPDGHDGVETPYTLKVVTSVSLQIALRKQACLLDARVETYTSVTAILCNDLHLHLNMALTSSWKNP